MFICLNRIIIIIILDKYHVRMSYITLMFLNIHGVRNISFGNETLGY